MEFDEDLYEIIKVLIIELRNIKNIVKATLKIQF